jgi:hypothetical protein
MKWWSHHHNSDGFYKVKNACRAISDVCEAKVCVFRLVLSELLSVPSPSTAVLQLPSTDLGFGFHCPARGGRWHLMCTPPEPDESLRLLPRPYRDHLGVAS